MAPAAPVGPGLTSAADVAASARGLVVAGRRAVSFVAAEPRERRSVSKAAKPHIEKGEAEADGVSPGGGQGRRLLAVAGEGGLLVVAHVEGLGGVAVTSGAAGLIITSTCTLVRGRRNVAYGETRRDMGLTTPGCEQKVTEASST